MSVTSVVGTRRTAKADAIVVFVVQDEKHFNAAQKSLTSDIPHLLPLFASGDFTAKANQTALAYGGSATVSPRVILVGMGQTSSITPERIRRAAAAAAKRAGAAGCSTIALETMPMNGIDSATVAQALDLPRPFLA